jgi:hypothetical protein
MKWRPSQLLASDALVATYSTATGGGEPNAAARREGAAFCALAGLCESAGAVPPASSPPLTKAVAAPAATHRLTGISGASAWWYDPVGSSSWVTRQQASPAMHGHSPP